MNKKTALIFIILVFALSGCVVAEEFNRIKQEYLQSRVEQLLTTIPTSTLVIKMPTTTAVLPTLVATATPPAAEEIEETAEPAETAQPTAAATLQPTPTIDSDDPAVYLGKAAWNDTMDEAKYWPPDTDEFTSAYFENGYFRMTALQTVNGWRMATTPKLGNNYIEATITTESCSGSDQYGLIFRVPVLKEPNRGYLFGLTCDGRYSLRKWDETKGENGLMIYLLRWTADSTILKGSNQTNRIGVMTIDDRIIMFVNGVVLGEVSDKDFPEGFFGVFAGSATTQKFTIRVEDVSYWSNPSLAE